jgi:elongation factor G
MEGKFVRQSGGRGQFGHVWIEVEPNEKGKGYEFENAIVGGSIPKEYINPVSEGIVEAMRNGVLAGYPVEDIKVKLFDGSYHEVDSSEMAFKIAGSLAYKDAMSKARPTMLEPIMKVEIFTSDDFMGDIMSDLSQRRGRPQGMDSQNGTQVVNALVPMAEMLNYAPALRSMTQGRSNFHMEFSHYDEVPQSIQKKLIEEAQREQED